MALEKTVVIRHVKTMFERSSFLLAGSSSLSYNTPTHTDPSPRLTAKDGRSKHASVCVCVAVEQIVCLIMCVRRLRVSEVPAPADLPLQAGALFVSLGNKSSRETREGTKVGR